MSHKNPLSNSRVMTLVLFFEISQTQHKIFTTAKLELVSFQLITLLLLKHFLNIMEFSPEMRQS